MNGDNTGDKTENGSAAKQCKNSNTAKNGNFEENFETLPTFYPPTTGGSDKEEDFEITRKEFDQIKNALKNEEFRKLLVEYVDDVQDPKSQATYQSEVRQLEKDNGNIVHFLNTLPGYVLKTSIDGKKKGFINICSNPLIRRASKNGCLWSIPYAQSPARQDLDKAGAFCEVYDVIFHPDSLHLASKNAEFRKKIEEIALEGVEKSFNVKLDRNNLKKPKLQFKGAPRATVIKYKIGDVPPACVDPEAIKNEMPPQSFKKLGKLGKDSELKMDKHPMSKLDKKLADSNDYSENVTSQERTVPRYSLKYRSHVDLQDCCIDNQRSGLSSKPIPDEVILTIDLPLLSDSSSLDADVLDDGWHFELVSNKKALYELKLKLPFKVHPETAKAKFEKDNRKLHVTIKTVQVRKPVETFVRQLSDDVEVFETEENSESSSSENEIHEKPRKLIEELPDKKLERHVSDVGYESNESNENIPTPTVINGNVVVKSILKGSVAKSVRCRSMSESWVEHMDHLNREDFASLESLSESNELLTVSESSESGPCEKSVRFSDQVQRQLFRSNSSILGQRKKNQKRNKNKRKNRERHNSEGSVSSFDDEPGRRHENESEDEDKELEEACEPKGAINIRKNKKQKPCKSNSLE